MHILIAANNFFPDPGAGGSGRYIHETGRRLTERGHRVSIITRRTGDTDKYDTISGMNIYRYDVSITRLPHSVYSIQRWCHQLHDQDPVDLLNFHGPLTSMFVDKAFPAKLKRVYTFHGPWPAEYRERNSDKSFLLLKAGICAREQIEKCVLNRSELYITLSVFMELELEKWYGCTHEGRVIPGGVDTDRFQPSSNARSEIISNNNITILTIRRLTPRMGIEQLIDDFAKLQETHPNTHLYIGGDGPLRSSLERQVTHQGIDSSVTFLGYIDESTLPDIYNSADIFVLPTTALEGFGLATLEALASATPVIATDVGGTPEILRSLDEHFSESPPLLVNNHSQLLKGLKAWVDCTQSMRNKVAQVAREYVISEYTWQRTTSRLENSFRNLINIQ